MLNYYDFSAALPLEAHLYPNVSMEHTGNSKPTEETYRQKPRVLVFAADENTRTLYKTLLEIWDYEVEESENAEQTAHLVEDKRPDAILMDTPINLTESLEAMKKLRTDRKLEMIPFVLISGHAQSAVRQRAFAAGANGFCVKPVDFGVLETTLKSCIDKSQDGKNLINLPQ